MSTIDIIVLIITILIVTIIIFFSYILPKIQGKRISCASCPAAKKGKKLIKYYKRKKEKN